MSAWTKFATNFFHEKQKKNPENNFFSIYLKYLRVKSTEDLTRPKNTDRPLSVSSVLLKTSWKNEKELEEASSLRF